MIKMYSLVQLTKCFVFITIFGNILSLALLRRDLGIISSSKEASNHRIRRQGPVIQPSWSFDSGESLFQDYNVRVTDKKLEETEALREYIQETVDNGTYVVELDEADFEEKLSMQYTMTEASTFLPIFSKGDLKSDEEIPAEKLSQPEPEPEPEPQPEPQPEPEPEPEPQPEVELKTTTVPVPKPELPPVPEQKPFKLFNKFKIVPKRYLGSSPFLLWFKKKV